MKVGSENVGVTMNGALVAAGMYTGGNSAVQFTVTQNLAAKRFYLFFSCRASLILSQFISTRN